MKDLTKGQKGPDATRTIQQLRGGDLYVLFPLSGVHLKAFVLPV